MAVSMNPAVRYVTQSSIWDVPKLGPLTNYRIRKYQLAGVYGEEVQKRTQRIVAAKRAKQSRREVRLKAFLSL